MYNILTTIQCICLAAILLELLLCMHHKSSRLQSMMLLSLLDCLVMTLGVLFDLRSRSIGTALLAHKCIYSTEIFLLSGIFIFMLNYCNIKHSRFFSDCLVFIDLILFVGLSTCEKHTYYYTNIRFTSHGIYPHLEPEPGPLAFIFQILIVYFIIAIPSICLFQAHKSSYQSIKSELFHLFALLLLPLVGSALNISDMIMVEDKSKLFDTVVFNFIYLKNMSSVAYVLFTTLSLILLYQHNWFDHSKKGNEIVVKNLEKEVRRQTRQIEKIQNAIISCFADMIEARDGVTGLHVKRTSSYVNIITHELANRNLYPSILTEDYIEDIVNSAPLHDIGKIAVPDAILQKPSRLTEEEFAIIRKHPESGAKMIDDILKQVNGDNHLSVARDMVLYHHEKWDGTGYPYGIRGKNIPLSARIMAISDVYEALISKRSYKEGYPIEKALGIIKEGRGTYFDPQLVDVFVDVFDQIKAVE